MSLLGDFVSFGLNSGAAKKEAALKQQLLNESAGITRDEFDRRARELGLSDAAISQMLDAQHTEGAANEDKSFSYLLDQAKQGFDEQQQLSGDVAGQRYANENQSFGQQMSALDTLMTAQKSARMASQAASDAERARQLQIQGQADELSAALPGKIGYDAQTAGRQQAFGDRSALIKNTASVVAAPTFAGADPTVSGAYAAQADRGSAAGLGDALNQAGLASYGDAFQGAQRTMGGFADDVAGLTTKADISRSALPAELGVGKLGADNAKQRYDFASTLAKDMGDRKDQILADYGQAQSGSMSSNRDNIRGAATTYAEQMAKMLDDYYGRKMDSQSNYINGFVNSSQSLESKLLNLNNFKMGNTSVTSPLASTVKMIDKAGEQAAAMMVKGG